ncbi:MAG: hypothetical protein K9J16_08125 [Melioribacteraceae bacterium]|nr:hypothetical protein [Melioribacteraceae bacterium]MCF8353869.1 hypothetical protein [Melioribacteraceae bacterium]MCF8393102.1 hypothetical protein [Melioribacteraceae bacterium]MCF8419221.1 hypothetical protein [Melioribacteraceae bacterium]
MNTGQMMLTLGAMVLLTLLIMRMNNIFLSTGTVVMESKFEVLAVSLATSMIEEATSKAFDENTKEATVDYSNELSAIGPDLGETYELFDDFDDYHNYSRIDSTLPSATFNVSSIVDYINPSNPNLTTGSKTWHKKITVTVSSPSMIDSIKMSSIFSYWYFR